jgi:ABC-type nitrate/sulfonate/bicarbonate transport system ATPase subunit
MSVLAPAQTPPKISIRGLRKQFLVRGRAVEALAGINLDIGSGEFFCIVGPSGCGKTTMLRILAGLESGTAGSIAIAPEPSVSSSPCCSTGCSVCWCHGRTSDVASLTHWPTQ